MRRLLSKIAARWNGHANAAIVVENDAVTDTVQDIQRVIEETKAVRAKASRFAQDTETMERLNGR